MSTRACDRTPYEHWNGCVPDLNHIRIFGTKAFTQVPKERRTKLDDCGQEGLLVGYSETSKGYRILNPKSNKIIISRSVIFKEEKIQEIVTQIEESLSSNNPEELVHSTLKEKECEEDVPLDPKLPETPEASEPRRSARYNKGVPPIRFAYKAHVGDMYEPQSWKEVVEIEEPHKGLWLKAAQEEMDSLSENETWELTNLPEDRKAVGCRWTFKLKYDAQGNVNRHKARLVAKGYSQKYGVDYDEVFAPVIKQSTIRTLFTIAGAKKLQMRHLDIKTAFLHGDITEEVYMQQPEGYVKPGEEELVCKLKKCIYGLKQSARAWNQKIDQILTQKGYAKSKADPCLYSMQREGKWTYILIYVDDILVCSETDQEIVEAIEILRESLEVKDLGNVTFYLGMQIERKEDGSYLLHQATKIKNILEKFGMTEAKKVSTPMLQDYPKLTGEEDALPNNTEYRQAVGALLFIATSSRPDISAAIGVLCRRVSNPRQRDWIALKRVMRYLLGTIDAKLHLGKHEELPALAGFVDADWGGDATDRKSTTGYLFQIGESAISWCSRKQTAVALSSTEAEYMAAALASQEAAWLRLLLQELGYPQEKATVLHEDNQGCIKIAQTERINPRTKHIDVKFHHLKDLQEKGIINLVYCPTADMLADIMTKPLPPEKFHRLSENMGLKQDIC